MEKERKLEEANALGLKLHTLITLERVDEKDGRLIGGVPPIGQTLFGVLTYDLCLGKPVYLNFEPVTDPVVEVSKADNYVRIETEMSIYRVTFEKVKVCHIYTDTKFITLKERIGDKVKVTYISETPDGKYHLNKNVSSLSSPTFNLLIQDKKVKRLKKPIIKNWNDDLYVNTEGDLFSLVPDTMNFVNIGKI